MAMLSVLRSWLPAGARRRAKPRGARPARLRIEPLESRTLLDGGVPAGPPLDAPQLDHTKFLSRVYYDLLHRAPGATELTDWLGALERGVTPAQAVGAFLVSAEYRGNLIRANYRTLLGREPDGGGFAAWMNGLVNGLNEENIRAAFLGSPEYYQRHGNNPRGWLTSLYGAVLGRAPDAGGLTAWTQAVQAGTDRGALAYSFIASQEARTGFIGEQYAALLHRPVDATGRGNWLAALNLGARPFQITAAVAGSGEYYQRALDEELVAPRPLQVETVGGGHARSRVSLTEPRPTLTGTGYPGTPLLVYVDDVASMRTQVSADGTWTVVPARGLPAGDHLIQVRPVDGSAAGAAVAVSAFNLAVPAPQVSLQAPEFTRQTAPSVTVGVAGLYDPEGVGVQAFIDVDLNRNSGFGEPGEAGRATSVVVDGANLVSLTNLPKGTYNLRARVRDQAGNEAMSAIVSMAIDPDAGALGSSWLQKLAEERTAAVTSGTEGSLLWRNRSRFFVFDAQGRVLVNVRATVQQHLGAFRAELERLGMQVTWVEQAQNLVVGYLPVERVGQLVDVTYFAAVTPVLPLITNVGAAKNQGDTVMKTDQFRTSQSVNGAGVKVGVISDSANQLNFGLADSFRTGDLPSDVELLRDGAFGDTDEGRAMLEIIHDIAPGAKLSFHTAGAGSAQFFAGAIRALADAGSKVIVDDIGLFVAPFFNDGVVNQAVDEVTARGVSYVSAAGNIGDAGYLASWKGVDKAVGGIGGIYQDVGGNGDHLQNFSVGPGETMTIILGWDTPWLEGGSPDPAFQVNNQVHLVISSADGATRLNNTIANNELVTLGGVDNNPNTGQAQQIVQIQNFSTTARYAIAMALHSVSGPQPTQVRWVARSSNIQIDAEYAGGPTVFGHPTARSAIAVGAVPWWRPELPGDPGTRTSLGGNLPYLFARDGTRLATPELRYKPEVAAPDGVSTSFFGSSAPRPDDPDPDPLPRFFGTSAAAPQVAALIALIRQQNPGASVSQIMEHLKRTARDVGAPGVDPYTGNGLVQAAVLTGGGTGGPGTPPTTPPLPADRFESNDTSDVATALGNLAAGSTSLTGLTIGRKPNGLPDYDWYRATPTAGGVFTARLSYNSPEGGDLHVRIFTRTAAGTLLELGSSRGTGVTSQSVSVIVAAGTPIFVWVYGFNSVQGNYDLTLDLA